MVPLLTLALIIGLLLILSGRATRTRHGLTQGRTLALDNRTLYSATYGLAGRPDRILAGYVPEEWKPGSRVYPSHRAQLGTYFILIEEVHGIRPTHGFIGLRETKKLVRIENTPELRAWVLSVAEQVRAVKRNPQAVIQVNQPAAKCRGCGMREGCSQAKE